LIVIAGPTASGKSGLAMAIAHHLNIYYSQVNPPANLSVNSLEFSAHRLSAASVILSADSRQVYREFDIGTAKPSESDQQAVPHRLVDICEPTETLTVADYQQQAQGAIAQVHQAGNQFLLLVGGTGLYLNAIVKGLKIPKVAPCAELRSQLTQLGQSHCYDLLRQVDPQAIQRIHPNDQIRTLRALEVFYVSGQPISSQQGENPPHYPILYIGLACEAEALRSRIVTRTHQMVEAGFMDEVADLIRKYGADLPLLKTLGYAEMQQHLNGELSLAQAIDLTVQHTCQFAKRQRTWFRKEPSIQWFHADSSDLVAQVWAQVNRFIQSNDLLAKS